MKYILLLLLLSATCNASVYKWIDANGNTHYSDKEPKFYAFEKITVKEYVDSVEKRIKSGGQSILRWLTGSFILKSRLLNSV